MRRPTALNADPLEIAAALEWLLPGTGTGVVRIEGVLHITGPGPLPTDAAITQAIGDRQAAMQQTAADTAAMRQQVRTAAQSAVGMRADQLTAAQVRALFVLVLFREGALDRTGVVRPLTQWVRD